MKFKKKKKKQSGLGTENIFEDNIIQKAMQNSVKKLVNRKCTFEL